MKKCNLENIESGRSMIEMLGVLAIIGVLSVGGITGYSKAMMKYRINKTIEQITLVAGNVRAFSAPQKSYKYFRNSNGNIDYQVAKKAKLVPDDMWDGNDIKNVWGGYFLLDAQMDKVFTISLNKIPLEACIELATHNWKSISAQGIEVAPSVTSIRNYGGVGNCNQEFPPFHSYIDCNASMPIEKATQYCVENAEFAIAIK